MPHILVHGDALHLQIGAPHVESQMTRLAFSREVAPAFAFPSAYGVGVQPFLSIWYCGYVNMYVYTDRTQGHC